MRTFLFVIMFAHIAVAQADVTYNCTVTESNISNLQAGDKFILTEGLDKVFGNTTYKVTAKSMGLDEVEVGAKPEIVVGFDARYTLIMPDSSQCEFYLKVQELRNEHPGVLTLKGPQQTEAKLLCQVL